MAEADFGVTYHGPALNEGRMAVRDLAPALLALGELFTDVGKVTMPDRKPIGLTIRATEQGSFLVHLVLEAESMLGRVVDLLTTPEVAALVLIRETVIGEDGLFAFIKRVRGRRITEEEQISPGVVRVILVDGTSIETTPDVLTLFNNVPIRRKARQVVEPLGGGRVDTIRFHHDSESLDLVAADLSSFDLRDQSSILVEEEREMYLYPSTAVLDGSARKWEFASGEFRLKASIEDEEFLGDVGDGERFGSGDILHCRVRYVQRMVRGKLQDEWAIVRVLKHIPPGDQLEIGES